MEASNLATKDSNNGREVVPFAHNGGECWPLDSSKEFSNHEKVVSEHRFLLFRVRSWKLVRKFVLGCFWEAYVGYLYFFLCFFFRRKSYVQILIKNVTNIFFFETFAYMDALAERTLVTISLHICNKLMKPRRLIFIHIQQVITIMDMTYYRVRTSPYNYPRRLGEEVPRIMHVPSLFRMLFFTHWSNRFDECKTPML